MLRRIRNCPCFYYCYCPNRIFCFFLPDCKAPASNCDSGAERWRLRVFSNQRAAEVVKDVAWLAGEAELRRPITGWQTTATRATPRRVHRWASCPRSQWQVGQLSLASPPWLGAMRTSEGWDVNRHTARCTSPVSVVWQCKLVSGWGLMKQRSAPAYGRCGLGRTLLFFTIFWWCLCWLLLLANRRRRISI